MLKNTSVVILGCLFLMVIGASFSMSDEPKAAPRGLSAVELAAQLRELPQVDFDVQYMQRKKKDIADRANEIRDENKKDAKNGRDAFMRKLLLDRRDLAGMPFLLGPDCSLMPEKAKDLLRCSLAMRDALSEATQKDDSGKHAPAGVDRTAHFLWEKISGPGASVWKKPESLPAMQQILLAETRDFRQRMVIHVSDMVGAQASEILARIAVYDIDPEIRDNAVRALRDRPRAEYRAALQRALRYPWAPAVRHAAHAVAALTLDEMIPELVGLLDAPAPENAYAERIDQGEPKPMVREVVRVNHHRNCLLCHAPIEAGAPELQGGTPTLPVGPVPAPDEPLPPSRSAVYYGPREGVTLVRADITYLRQDFSLLQSVEKPGQWPEQQRFDFLVRTRELSQQDMDYRQEKKAIVQFLESNATLTYRQTIAATLRRLTGKNAPANAAAWREVLELAN